MSPKIRTRALWSLFVTIVLGAGLSVAITGAGAADLAIPLMRHAPIHTKAADAARAAAALKVTLAHKPAVLSHGRLISAADYTQTHQPATPKTRTKAAAARPAVVSATSATASISGTVLAPGGGGATDVCANVYSASNEFDPVGSACTDNTGHYTVDGLDAGQYLVQFSDNANPVRYLEQWYSGKPDFNSADPVVVADGAAVNNINVSMAAGASISGTVLAQGGGAAENVCAVAYSASDTFDPVAQACSDTTGHYTISGLPAGQYLVQFVDGDTTRHDIPQWYNGKPDANSADVIVVNSGATLSNINASLTNGGWITGTVKDAATNQPLQDICVSVFDLATGSVVGPGGWFGDSVCTDDQGVYRTGGLPAGSFKVEFWGGGSYLDQWYNAKPDYNSADSVTVALNAATANVNAAMQLGGTISGTVTDANGPVDGACVEIDGDSSSSFPCTDATGSYQSSGLAPGSYKIKFTPPDGSGDQAEWYNDKPDFDTADAVALGAGQNLTGINATLASGGSISGTVTDGNGQPLADICIRAFAVDTFDSYPQNSEVCTDAQGSYTLSGLPTDQYEVQFSEWFNTNRGYLTQYYPNMLDSSLATTVSVTAGQTHSGVNDTMVRGAQFSGTVTDSVTQAPLSSICVTPVSTDSNNFYSADWSCSDSSGHYTTRGVPAGTYKIDFQNPNGRYIEQWYNNAPDQNSAQELTIALGVTTPNINASMHLGGNISGTVTAASGGAPLEGICVTLLHTDGSFGGDGGCTDATGHYASAAVAAGTYKVRFDDDSGSYGTQYYNGKATLAAADPVTVTTGSTTTGINAALAGTSTPGAPTNVTATAGDGKATVQWVPPVANGGSDITGYVITPFPACAACTGLTSAGTSTTVDGLTNGTAYTFTVSAVNANGTGDESLPSNAVTPAASTGGGPATAPGAPTGVVAKAQIADVKVSYTAPADDGGAAISAYTVIPSPACPACTGTNPTGTTTTISGLTTGTAYTFTVRATNSAGTGPASSASNPATPTAVPLSPVNASTNNPATPAVATNNGTTATASGGTGTVTVSQYPANPAAAATYPSTGAFLDVSVSDASTFTSVVIKDCNLGGGASLEWWNPDAAGGAGAWQTVVGDPTDTSGLPGCLTVTLDASSSPTVAQLGGTIFGVVASAPGAPTGVTATAGNASATVSFTAPASNGGSSITGYTVVPSPACAGCTGTSTTGTSTVVNGLTNGVAYTFRVRATNAAGPGELSQPSAAVTPTAPTGSGGGGNGGCAAPFPDVPADSKFCADIAWLVSHHIATGFSDGLFHPAASITRQAWAAFLYRLGNPGKTPKACTSSAFNDVPASSPFCPYITWLAATHITSGYADGGFHPRARVTRQAMAAFMFRLVNRGSTAPACTSAPFNDVAAGSRFCGEIKWLASTGITTGFADGGFHPLANVTRQAMAAFLHRLATKVHLG